MTVRALPAVRRMVGGMLVAAGLSSGLLLASAPAEAQGGQIFWFKIQDECIGFMKSYMADGWTVHPDGRCFYDVESAGYLLRVSPPS